MHTDQGPAVQEGPGDLVCSPSLPWLPFPDAPTDAFGTSTAELQPLRWSISHLGTCRAEIQFRGISGSRHLPSAVPAPLLPWLLPAPWVPATPLAGHGRIALGSV